MLRGENMWFRPAIFIWLAFAQSFFKFHKNGDIRKLNAWYFRLWKNDFCRLYNERAIALQSSITIFLRHPVQVYLHEAFQFIGQNYCFFFEWIFLCNFLCFAPKFYLHAYILFFDVLIYDLSLF